MKVAILGYGIEGQSAYTYWKKLGADITICDQTENLHTPVDATAHLGPDYLNNLQGFDIICRTASINPKVVLAANPGVKLQITTVINEFLRVCPTRNIIGITGTKGKGTTSTLTAKMLESAGLQTVLAGNIGFSPLDYLDKITEDSWVVLELSSYQLQDITYSPRIAACLMVEPDHLNWHGTLDIYTQAKSNLFKHQNPEDRAIYYADNEISHSIASTSPGKKIPYYANPGAYVRNDAIVIDDTELCKTNELKLIGKHNWQNACAAATIVWQIIQSVAPIRNVLTSMPGLPHRLEFVREFEGIAYYNDSFASTPAASAAAIEAISGPKIMILGGFDRQLPLEEMVRTIQQNLTDIRALLLVGESTPRLVQALKTAAVNDLVHVSPSKTMADIVKEAHALATTGDSIILSPGFPSFDMFKNFEDRGLQFKKIVTGLK